VTRGTSAANLLATKPTEDPPDDLSRTSSIGRDSFWLVSDLVGPLIVVGKVV
jgi:hypothetical protein